MNVIELNLLEEIEMISNLWSKHNALMIKMNHNISENNSGLNLHVESENYLSQPVVLKSNPIEYWISYKVTSKYLSSIALKYLSVVGTLVSLERMFSRTETL